jgi:hypothetical protein
MLLASANEAPSARSRAAPDAIINFVFIEGLLAV